MAFRGYFTLNGTEIANSSRVVAHVGAETPTSDVGLLRANENCALTPVGAGRLLAEPAETQVPIEPGRLLGTIPDGSRLYGPGLAVVGDCWTPDNMCFTCRPHIGFDDSWDGLKSFLDSSGNKSGGSFPLSFPLGFGQGSTPSPPSIYRPELAPWYTTRVPESAEFGGVWVMDVQGLDVTPGQRDVTELAGDGSAVGLYRAASRKVMFDAVLIACSNAGLAYGLQWLSCQLGETNQRSDSTLRYFAAHPQGSAADPASLVREVHGVVQTQEVRITDAVNSGRGDDQRQATMYRVTWELTVTRPFVYTPPVEVPVEWDTITTEPIRWVHAADCGEPESCEDMPVLYSTECAPERIEAVTSPPPTCGGCLPVCAVVTHVFEVPTFDYPIRCSQTATTLRVKNNGARGLTIQGYWRRCNSVEGCDDRRWPFQIAGLPPTAELVLDGVSGRFHVLYGGRKRRPWGIVGTPSGAPWQPALIDRSKCWELVMVTDNDATFDAHLTLRDREA